MSGKGRGLNVLGWAGRFFTNGKLVCNVKFTSGILGNKQWNAENKLISVNTIKMSAKHSYQLTVLYQRV